MSTPITAAEREHIGQRIVAARKRKGLSQKGLAQALSERSGIEADSIRRSLVNNERGVYAPRIRTLKAIAEITEQPISFFLGTPEVVTAPEPFPGAA